ncbi:MAG: hypothetical protein JWO32_597 [Bacteroidetes bacterium]|nr:hypothetical protein [Bacteroidota bacterium]
MKEKAILNWSGGKDSALCLYHFLKQDQFEVISLLTSVSEKHQRISMHGVRVELLEEQAKSIGLPLFKMYVPDMPTMEAYEKIMSESLTDFKNKGTSVSVFGDIFLEDLRKYREDQHKPFGMKALFPLWQRPTSEILTEFIDLGFKTIITCVNEKYLDKSFAGRIIDTDFINALPPNVDPCGENGEFHTFVFDGPLFSKPVQFEKGEIVYRKYENPSQNSRDAENNNSPYNTGFFYIDLLTVKK